MYTCTTEGRVHPISEYFMKKINKMINTRTVSYNIIYHTLHVKEFACCNEGTFIFDNNNL